VLARLGFGAWDPQKHEDAAIFKENQRIRMFLELRKLHSNGAIRGYQLGQNTFCPQHHINRTLIEEE